MSTIRNKQRVFYLYRYLMEHTDDEHQVTMNDLIKVLKKEDASASRKTVKDDIEILSREGVDIVVSKSYYNSYFIGNRDFEMPEILLLAESVSSNKSLTCDQKQKLIRKMTSTLSNSQAAKVRKCIEEPRDRGTGNEKLYYLMDRVCEAISTGRKISVRLRDFEFPGSRPVKDNRIGRGITPVGFVCRNDRYYLIGYDGVDDKIKSAGTDSVTGITILKEEGDTLPEHLCGDKCPEFYDDGEPGDIAEVTLECNRGTVSSVIDRLGGDAEIWNSTMGSVYVKKTVHANALFYAFVFRYGGDVRIVSPKNVRDSYVDMLKKTLQGTKTSVK